MMEAMEQSQRELPAVDIITATIGRPTLEVAVASAIHQTYPNCRCVVIGDGPQPAARVILKPFLHRHPDRVLYVETPKKLGRAGNGAKEFWFMGDRCAEFFRFLDDDDYLPPFSVAEQVAIVDSDDVVLSICHMLACRHSRGRVVKHEVIPGEWEVGRIGCGNALVRTSAAAKEPFPDEPCSDFHWLKNVAEHGHWKKVDQVLYWYNQDITISR